MDDLSRWSKEVSKDLKADKTPRKDSLCMEKMSKEMLMRRMKQLDARIEAVKCGSGVNFPTLVLSLSMFFASVVTIIFNIYNSIGNKLNAAQILHSIWGDKALDAINELVKMDDVAVSVASNNDALMSFTLLLVGFAVFMLVALVGWILFDNGVLKKQEVETYILARSVCEMRLESMTDDPVALPTEKDAPAGDALVGARASTT